MASPCGPGCRQSPSPRGLGPCGLPSVTRKDRERMLMTIRSWLDRRYALRHRWQEDARQLLSTEETRAYYEAQRRATRYRVGGDRAEFYHWAKVAAEIARLSPQVEMDLTTLRAIVADEERRSG